MYGPVRTVLWADGSRWTPSDPIPSDGTGPGSVKLGKYMKYKFFKIPVSAPESAEAQLNAFLSGHQVIQVDKVFVEKGEFSFWAFSVNYREKTQMLPTAGRKQVDYKEVLNERDFNVFVKLRELRKQLADQEGVPAYAVFTNEQLAAMVLDRVISKTKLASVKGIGQSRVDKYGERFLALLKEELPEQTENGDGAE